MPDKYLSRQLGNAYVVSYWWQRGYVGNGWGGFKR